MSGAAESGASSIPAVRVEALDPAAAHAWDAYVRGHPDGTVFHTLGWKRAVERTFGHRAWYLVAMRERRMCGALPLFAVQGVVARRFLVSVPYATYGGLLADDDVASQALLAHAKRLAATLNANALELRSRVAADPALPVQDRHATFQRDLPDDSDAVAMQLPRKARAAARRAAEEGNVSVVFGVEHLETVWRLYARSMRRLGSPNYPLRFFEELAEALGQCVSVQLVRRQGRPVAGLVTFRDGETARPYFAGLDERANIYGLNNYLYLESMRWAVAQGCRRYDFGRSRADNPGPWNFKRFCGFEPEPLQYQTYVPPGRSAPQLSPAAPRWAVARRIWKRLPLAVTRPLGGWLAKSIPG